MSGPDYLNYTINELRDAKRNINKEKYPERYSLLKQEIDLRTEAGEIESDQTFNEFFVEDVPILLSLSIWWCFVWRSTLISILVSIVGYAFIMFLNKALKIDPTILSIIISVLSLLSVPMIGAFVMRQALVKRYVGYKLYFRKVD